MSNFILANSVRGGDWTPQPASCLTRGRQGDRKDTTARPPRQLLDQREAGGQARVVFRETFLTMVTETRAANSSRLCGS